MLAKDDAEHPLPVGLRATFQDLVGAFVAGDFQPIRNRPNAIAPIDGETAGNIAKNIAAYGDTLAPLRDEVWQTSIYRWTDGYWQVLVDLSTALEPVSDLVLHAKLTEDGSIEVQSVHVP